MSAEHYFKVKYRKLLRKELDDDIEKMFHLGYRDITDDMASVYHYCGKGLFDDLMNVNFESSCLEAEILKMPLSDHRFTSLVKKNRDEAMKSIIDILPDLEGKTLTFQVYDKEQIIRCLKRKHKRS